MFGNFFDKVAEFGIEKQIKRIFCLKHESNIYSLTYLLFIILLRTQSIIL